VDYKSLKDIYTSKVVGWTVPPLQRQKNLCLEQTQSVQPETGTQATPTEQVPVQQFDINKFTVGQWTKVQKGLFDKVVFKKTGEGRGEMSVASLLTGKTKPNELKRYVQGTTEAFDVAGLPNMPDAKFEVKEFKFVPGEPGEFKGSVRIGKEGAGTTNRIIAGLKRIFDDIENEYMALDKENRNEIDRAIIKTIFPSMVAPEPKAGPRSKGALAKSFQKAKERYDTAVSLQTKWTLEGYITALFDIAVGEDRSLSELPYSLFRPTWEEGKLPTMKTEIRKKYLLFPITQLLSVLEKLASTTKDDPTINPKLSELQAVVKKHYLPPDNTEYEQRLEREVEILDRKLTKNKCQLTGNEACKTIEEFYRAIKRLKLSTTFEDINKIRSTSAESLFPNITGLFIVHSNGYVYIPKNEINKKIFISQLTQGGLKIQPIPDILRTIVPSATVS